ERRPGFGGVVAVVEAEANNLARVGNGRQKLRAGRRLDERFFAPSDLLGGLPDRGRGFEQLPHGRRQGGIGGVQIDVVIAFEDRGSGAGRRLQGGKSHDRSPRTGERKG